MHTQHTFGYVALTIRRDASTTLSAAVPAHEVPILEHVFGQQYVERGEELSGVTHTASAAEEAERLIQKYGAATIAEIFGHDARNLKDALQAHAIDASASPEPRRGRPPKAASAEASEAGA